MFIWYNNYKNAKFKQMNNKLEVPYKFKACFCKFCSHILVYKTARWSTTRQKRMQRSSWTTVYHFVSRSLNNTAFIVHVNEKQLCILLSRGHLLKMNAYSIKGPKSTLSQVYIQHKRSQVYIAAFKSFLLLFITCPDVTEHKTGSNGSSISGPSPWGPSYVPLSLNHRYSLEDY